MEFGFAAIVTFLKTCPNFLAKKISQSKNEDPITTKSENDFQDGMENDKKDLQDNGLEQKTVHGTVVDLVKKVKLIRQELVELKRRVAVYENLDQYH